MKGKNPSSTVEDVVNFHYKILRLEFVVFEHQPFRISNTFRRFKFTVIIFCLFDLTQTIPHAIIRLTIYSVQEKTVSIVGQGFSSHDWVPVITYDKLLPFIECCLTG